MSFCIIFFGMKTVQIRVFYSLGHPKASSSQRRTAHPDAVLAQTLPEAVTLRIDRHDHMVDGLGDGVLPFQVHPRGEVHDALRQLLHVEGVESG